MQRLGGAAIHMQQALDKIIWVIGNGEILDHMSGIPALPVFDDRVISFLDNLSRIILADKEARKFPDVVAYAFWIRKASLIPLKEKYSNGVQKIGRGIVFHIAPSNIPVQFAVSLAYALIAGNASVIRISNKRFQQVGIICDCIKQVFLECGDFLEDYICVVRYSHDEGITQAFSDICDVRVIWGGDDTIKTIRQCPVQPRCIDLGFADRYSLCVIDSDVYMGLEHEIVAKDFYNDTYFNDQNACSSPRLVVWTGNKIEEAKEEFWNALEEVVLDKYKMEAIMSSEKLLRTAICASVHSGIRQIKKNNYIVRVELPEMYEDIMEYKGTCGYFFEYEAEDLQEIIPMLKKECQTITYIGEVEKRLRQLIYENGVRGVDRIVPIGYGSHISLVWDGIDLLDIMSRKIGNS